jgi:hypothetical protein
LFIEDAVNLSVFLPLLKTGRHLLFFLIYSILLNHSAFAQTLPPASRMVFKCIVEGKTIYTGAPCLGATKIDVEPTRGVNRLSGRELVGTDVRREHLHEALAEALRPISSMNGKQFEIQGRRMKLPISTQNECRDLERAIPIAELEETRFTQPQRKEINISLLGLRQRFVDLRC